MAAPKRRRGQAWPEEGGEGEHGLYSLHRMFEVVGSQLTHRDVRVLSFLFVDVIDDYERGRIRGGRDFLLALERQGRCDESNLRQVLQLLRIITRHDLLPYVTLKRRRAVCPDLVDKYLEETSIRYVTPRAAGRSEQGLAPPHKSVPPHHPVVCCSPAGPQLGPKRPGRGRSLLGGHRKRRKSATPDPKEKQTCGPPGAAVRALQPGQHHPQVQGPGLHHLRHQVLRAHLPRRLLARLHQRLPAGGPQGSLHHGLAEAGGGARGHQAAGQRGRGGLRGGHSLQPAAAGAARPGLQGGRAGAGAERAQRFPLL
ncbi:death effector domain-containing protein isoform X3 [Dryobates pubescens]|uniref:death effector domain-containing protein isoform X3 n=1 Tax=Dryobates pubescens TaxID=118200 RepID=UPI0023B9E202|nr:death effector domain-containing protein isoform X3 [Dryobates pubescens]